MAEQKPDDRQILQRLTELHDELERIHSLDENELALVQHLMADIQEHLHYFEEGSATGFRPSQTLLDRLRQAIKHFEVSHPALTHMIEEALEDLDMAGI